MVQVKYKHRVTNEIITIDLLEPVTEETHNKTGRYCGYRLRVNKLKGEKNEVEPTTEPKKQTDTTSTTSQ